MSADSIGGEMDFSKLKVAELKQELKKRGLSVEGKKNELIERLQTCIGDSAFLDDTHDDLLDDDISDEGVLDDPAIDAIPPEPQTDKSLKRPAETEKACAKKIILNRKLVEIPEANTVDEPKEEEEEKKPSSTVPMKIIGLSEKEKLEKRAARFGAALGAQLASDDAEKSARAIKFGESPAAALSNVNANLDVLKKRAERFGTIAPILEKVTMEEKKKERLSRFGVGTDIKSASSGDTDKKAQRAARFEIK